MIIPSKAVHTAAQVIHFIAVADYAGLIRFSSSSRLNTDDIQKVISDYGRTPTDPESISFQSLDIIEQTDSTPPRWSINCPIFTQEEGPSDLTLQMTFIDGSASDHYSVELDDLHVL